MRQNPLDLNFGQISLVFNKICGGLKSCGFSIRSQMNSDGSIRSWQTVQFYFRNEDRSQTNPIIGAVQYEGSNDFSVRPPDTVNLRFYRRNLPKELRELLENIDDGFRKDTNDGPRVNPEAQSIAFKFFSNDEQTNRFINGLISQLNTLLKSY